MTEAVLFQPFECKSLRLRNRIVMSPMTRAMSPENAPTAQMRDYYARRAAGGTGFIISEGVGVERAGALNQANVPHFFGELALSRWREVIERVHDAGGKFAPQLWHVGGTLLGAPDRSRVSMLESPSGMVDAESGNLPPMPVGDIGRVIEAFAAAAANAQAIGADAVEIHGAHGYLIDQFFWERTNRRSDAYGGVRIEDRLLFAVELVQAIRRRVSPDFAVLLRISQWKSQEYSARLAESPQQLARWVGPLADAGVDIFDCSQRRFQEPEFAGSTLNLAGWVKRLTGKPTITVGSVGLAKAVAAESIAEASPSAPLTELHRRLDAGEFDLVAVGRALLADPEWAHKIERGHEHLVKPYSADALLNLL